MDEKNMEQAAQAEPVEKKRKSPNTRHILRRVLAAALAALLGAAIFLGLRVRTLTREIERVDWLIYDKGVDIWHSTVYGFGAIENGKEWAPVFYGGAGKCSEMLGLLSVELHWSRGDLPKRLLPYTEEELEKAIQFFEGTRDYLERFGTGEITELGEKDRNCLVMLDHTMDQCRERANLMPILEWTEEQWVELGLYYFAEP